MLKKLNNGLYGVIYEHLDHRVSYLRRSFRDLWRNSRQDARKVLPSADRSEITDKKVI